MNIFILLIFSILSALLAGYIVYKILCPRLKSAQELDIQTKIKNQEILIQNTTLIEDNIKLKLSDGTMEELTNLTKSMLLEIAPEKTFKQLGSRLKRDYYASKISHFFDIHGHIRNLMMKLPKECEKPVPIYNPQETINSGYEFVMKNKDNLGTLSLYSQNKNADFIKGMLKALKELGLVK